nr:CoA transferase [Desulfobacterales bacterium]
MRLPLEGIRILDLSQLLPGPFCSMLLGDLGAEIVKIEPPGGDPARTMLTPGYFESINRNKKSIVLDLKNRLSKSVFFSLVETADIVIEGFRPGTVKRLGIDYKAVRSVNHGIIYCSISGYGQSGPYRNRPGHDINYAGVAGIISLCGEPDGPPSASYGVAIVDLSSALFATISILAAIRARDKTGRGEYIDVSMTDAAVSLMINRIPEYFLPDGLLKEKPSARGSYGVFRTKDDKYITLGVAEDHFWLRLCKVMDRDDLKEDPRFSSWIDRNKNRKELIPILEEFFLQRTKEECIRLLVDADIPCGPVNSIEEIFRDEHLSYRKIFDETDHPNIGKVKQVLFPVRFSETSTRIRSPAPSLGEHTEEILKDLGYTKDQIENFRVKKVIE